jgi:hypothetical protein
MAASKIDRPALIQPKVLEEFQKSMRAGRAKAGPRRDLAEQIGQAPAAGDRAEISAQGKKLEDLRRTFTSSRPALASAPDVRQERLSEVRARLQSGFYNTDEVRQQVAARLGAVLKRLDSLID